MKEWTFDFREMSLPKDKAREFLYQHGYYFALFDVLGFENRIRSIGLDRMYDLYKNLISITKETNEFAQRIFKSGITDAFAFDGGVAIYYPVFSAYASDTIILWADRTAIAAKLAAISGGDVQSFKGMREFAWASKPVPPDPFLKVCCELMCKSIEIGLPLRGALTIGDLRMEPQEGIYLGIPIVDAARIEPEQDFLGASLHKSFHEGIVPKRYTLPFEEHFKSEKSKSNTLCTVLDWPRHWKETRETDLHDDIYKLDLPTEKLRNTKALIELSDSRVEIGESTRDLYPEFYYPDAMLQTVEFSGSGDPRVVGVSPDNAPFKKETVQHAIQRAAGTRNNET